MGIGFPENKPCNTGVVARASDLLSSRGMVKQTGRSRDVHDLACVPMLGGTRGVKPAPPSRDAYTSMMCRAPARTPADPAPHAKLFSRLTSLNFTFTLPIAEPCSSIPPFAALALRPTWVRYSVSPVVSLLVSLGARPSIRPVHYEPRLPSPALCRRKTFCLSQSRR